MTVGSFGGLESIRKELVKTVCDSVTEETGPPVEEPMIETAPPKMAPPPAATPVPQPPPVVWPTAAPAETPVPQSSTETPTAKTQPPAAEEAEEEKDKEEEELEEECTMAPIAAVADCEAAWKKCFTVVKTEDCQGIWQECMDWGWIGGINMDGPVKDARQCSTEFRECKEKAKAASSVNTVCNEAKKTCEAANNEIKAAKARSFWHTP